MYLLFCVHDVHGRRHAGAAASAPSCSSPGLQFVNPELFNQLTTMHGLIMVFGAIMPAFVGFANWMVPLQIGAPDMAFARMNNLSFWLLIPRGDSCSSARSSCPAARAAAGWTLYAPLTLQMGPSMDAGDLRAAHHGRVARSWARSTSSSPSSTCARPA